MSGTVKDRGGISIDKAKDLIDEILTEDAVLDAWKDMSVKDKESFTAESRFLLDAAEACRKNTGTDQGKPYSQYFIAAAAILIPVIVLIMGWAVVAGAWKDVDETVFSDADVLGSISLDDQRCYGAFRTALAGRHYVGDVLASRFSAVQPPVASRLEITVVNNKTIPAVSRKLFATVASRTLFIHLKEKGAGWLHYGSSVSFGVHDIPEPDGSIS